MNIKLAYLCSFVLSVLVKSDHKDRSGSYEVEQEATTAQQPMMLSHAEKQDILNIENNYRRAPRIPGTNLNELAWNYAFEQAFYSLLIKVATATGSLNSAYEKLLYDKYSGCQAPAGYLTNTSYHCLLDNAELAEFKAQGCEAVDVDSLAHGKFVPLIEFRIKRDYCIDIKNCNTKNYTGFETCAAKGVIVSRALGYNCANFWMYNPRYLIAEWANITLIPTPIPPPFIAYKQNQGYVLFACSDKRANTNDMPYQIGPSASKCTTNRYAVNGLCRLQA